MGAVDRDWEPLGAVGHVLRLPICSHDAAPRRLVERERLMSALPMTERSGRCQRRARSLSHFHQREHAASLGRPTDHPSVMSPIPILLVLDRRPQRRELV